MKKILLDKILVDSRIQPRSELIQQAIDDYSIAMREGAKFPPIVVFENGEGSFLLAHGFHRYRAALKAELQEISAEINKGDLHDARLFAAGANKSQDKIGVRWTNKDKRHAVEMLLGDEKWSGKSDRWIAGVVGVGHDLVRGMRPALAENANATRETKDGRRYPAKRKSKEAKAKEEGENGETENIGKTKEGSTDAFDSCKAGGNRSSEEFVDMGGSSGRDQKSRDPARVDWGKEFGLLKKKGIALVGKFDGLEGELNSFMAEIRDFVQLSSLRKESEELQKEMLKVVCVADRIRNKFMDR